MSHIRFLKSGFDKDFGHAWVKKSSQYGTFIGHAYCSPEDADIESEFVGCTIAEYRADIEIANAKRRCLRQRYLGIKHLNNTIFKNWESRIFEAHNIGHYEAQDMMLDMRIQEEESKRLADEAWCEWQEMKDNEWIFIENILDRKRKCKK
jgi:hypothetical protein